MPIARRTKSKAKAAPTLSADAFPVPPSFYDPVRDGVTYSLLSTFRDCREKARLHLAGWAKHGGSTAMLFGNVVHAAFEHSYRAWRDGEFEKAPPKAWVHTKLDEIEAIFRSEHGRMSAEEENDLQLVTGFAAQIIPRYFSYWTKNDRDMQWLETEQEFRLPWAVTMPAEKGPNGWHEPVIHTFLRGKIDGLFQEKGRKTVGVFETKTKGRVDPGNLLNILGNNLQVGIYIISAYRLFGKEPSTVLYNIVRRPQLRQKQSEDLQQFMARVGDDIADRPDFYFMRIRMEVTDKDIGRFEGELNELMRDFLLWWYGKAGHYKNDGHCENKYGDCPFLAMCGRGAEGMNLYYKRPKVFSELEEV